MLALLDPSGRAATLQAWLRTDLRGKSEDSFPLDCTPAPPALTNGSSCTYPTAAAAAADSSSSSSSSSSSKQKEKKKDKTTTVAAGVGDNNVYPFNIWSYGLAISNHLAVNNDSAFLRARAGATNLTVDEAFEGIALDWQGAVVPGTAGLVDYGGAIDGFSPTYQHVVPGMQGNNLWMTRRLAALRDAQGQSARAAELRGLAAGMAAETIGTMYSASSDGERGWFNVLWPALSSADDGGGGGGGGGVGGQAAQAAQAQRPMLRAYEMRHIVDFFSLAIGMCTDTHSNGNDGGCDVTAAQRAQLSRFFAAELQTKDWVRATSPVCNCNHSWDVAVGGAPPAPVPAPSADDPFPALVSCAADREDHGTTGAYTAWPALAAEALCYFDGNCSAALDLLASFAPSTYFGAFGQAYAVPQQREPPYTPFDGEPASKPNDRRYLNMAAGAFFDGIVRGLFGYHPDMLWPDVAGARAPAGAAQAALDATLLTPKAPRGFSGSLSNLRTPLGLATIVSGPSGLSITLQKE